MEISVQNSAGPLKTDSSAASLNESTLLGGVLALTALVYAATLRFDFVYDDQNAIVRNPLVRSWQSVPGYFMGKEWPATLFPNASANYYRPINVLWYRINDAVFGLNPVGWHATTILLHLLATFLVYVIARRITGRPLVAALTALFFGIHPTRHEVVSWVSGTTDLLWSVLFLLAFLAYLKSREGDRTRWIVISCALYGAALLAKETAIVFPVVVFAHAWLYGTKSASEDDAWSQASRVWKAAALAALYGVVAIAYLGVRIAALHGFEHPQSNIPLRTLVLTIPSVAFFYVRQWLLPMNVGEFYDLPLWSKFDALHVLVPFLALVVLAAVLWFFRKKLGSREVVFAAVWLIAPLLPVLDFAVLPPGQLVHDRYLYLASFGAALLCALVLSKLATGPTSFGIPRRLLIPMLAIVVLSCYATADASSYWEDDYTLFQHSYQLTPTNIVARVNYAIAVARHGDYMTAMPLLDSVLYEDPNNWLANYNLGRVFYEMGLYPAAEGRSLVVERLFPTMADNYLQLGMIDIKTNRPELAEENIRRAVELQPSETAFRFSLGVALEVEGKCDEARAEFTKTLAIDPTFPKAEEQMAKCNPKAALNRSTAGVGENARNASGASLRPAAQADAVNAQ
jgi:protein O-mannosyl-transferase